MNSNKGPTKDLGFYCVAAVSFHVALGDPYANAKSMIEWMKEAARLEINLLVFPELSMTGYTCGDLFLRKELYEQTEYALRDIKAASADCNNLLVCVGMPIEDHGKLFNCAVYVQSGEIVGVVPKTYIPNYGEYYEKRWFVSSTCRKSDQITLLGCTVPFSENLLLKGERDVTIATEICEDLWVDSPRSGLLSRAGATIIVNPSASNELVGKREYRRNLVVMQSGRCRAGYVYASCGAGESTTDTVFSGHCMIADNGNMVAENDKIMVDEKIVIGTIDIERCVNDRRKYNSDLWVDVPDVIEAKIFVPAYPEVTPGYVNPYPFVRGFDEKRFMDIIDLQARGLMQRMRATGITDMVLGISGGLDSTLALLVCMTVCNHMNLPRVKIHAISMPGFGTSDRTKKLATQLALMSCADFEVIDITDACKQHLHDIAHPEDLYDVVYENVQARERTQILFDYANQVNGLVIGTGDMSELALGWCTYNGDQMSNYAVNAGVPKTLVRSLIDAYAKNSEDVNERSVLKQVLELPVSPELLPTDKNGEIAQRTEDVIGSYVLHDFFLYHYIRNGFGKYKIFRLAQIAFNGKYEDDEIEKTLDTFYHRFRTQQFKRSCMPDSVKIGSVSLSPRGDLRMPSDLTELY